MKKRLFKKIILFIISAVFIILAASKINHSIKLSGEKKELQAYGVGSLVDYNGDKINIYTAGNNDAESTIVYMHGLGMGDTTVSARPLLKKFEDKYKTCVVDRYGNGLSSDTSKKQTVENIVEEYREVLKKDNQKAPYILFAHSISGIYASYWAEKYPDEIKSIVYIDADPAEGYYREGKLKTSEAVLGRLQNVITSLGLQRIFASQSGLLGDTENQVFTDDENKMRELLMFQNTYSKATCSEFELYYENAQKVLNENINFDIPQIYISASNVEGEYYENIYSKKLEKRFNNDENKIQEKINNEKDIIDKKIEYMENRKNIEIARMSGPHTLYEYNPEGLYSTISSFLNKNK